ncbi:MAG TPA: hypothetical protein VLR70_16460 [Arthrobacter sp.]|nr:hypothetical protein [Arthrobacter sp.]
MDESIDTPPLVAAPRHLRKRLFHAEVPDTLLVPGVDPFPLGAVRGNEAKPSVGTGQGRDQTQGRKRTVALVAVIFVSISIIALTIALILAG